MRDTMTEVRSVSSTGGEKGVKEERFDLIPIGALTALARHYGAGARKYDDNQWRKGYEWSKSYAALMRHLTQWWGGEDTDEETGSNHMAAVAWHAFTLLTFIEDFPEFDDRFKVGTAKNEQEGEDGGPVYVPEWFFNLGQITHPVNVDRPWEVGDQVDLIPVTLEGPVGPQSFTVVIRR